MTVQMLRQSSLQRGNLKCASWSRRRLRNRPRQCSFAVGNDLSINGRNWCVLYEYGHVIPKGIAKLGHARDIVEELSSDLPDLAREECRDLLEQVAEKPSRIDKKAMKAKELAAETDMARRLQTMPGVGPLTALAIEAFVLAMESFKRGRDFAAWLGLVPRQHSSGSKGRLG